MKTKKDQLMQYDPSNVGEKGSIFGLPYTVNTADIIIIPVPWDVTVSYQDGTANAPVAILEASPQLDLEIYGLAEAWKIGQCMVPFDNSTLRKSNNLREVAKRHIRSLESAEKNPDQSIVPQVNQGSIELNSWLQKQADIHLEQGKIVGVLGGDHSTPYGLIKALGKYYDSFAILQIDAHMDLRDSYEGFEFSHASIMHNVLKFPFIDKVVQLGIRDFSQEELNHPDVKTGRVKTFFDQEIRERIFHGDTWRDVVLDLLAQLPANVYISFDIDGLDPKLCPNTGTPVPGGMDMSEINYLLSEMVRVKKTIIGFDLVEVGSSANEWDQNVGARVLYNLGAFTGFSQGRNK